MPRRHRRHKLDASSSPAPTLDANGHDDNTFDMPTLPAAAADGGSLDTEWTRIHALLSCLLDIAVDTRFQHEPSHPQSSWLIVYLTRVENKQPQRKHALRNRMRAVLDAVATLCAMAERLRLRGREHEAFWRRVFTSQMMAEPLDSGDNRIWWFASHTRAREMRIKIHWTARTLERELLAPVQAFLDSDWAEYDRLLTGDRTLRLRRMRVAICVAHTKIGPKDMELLGDVIVRPANDDDGQPRRNGRLFEPAIASLEIRHTVLTVETLHALAARVYPRARPIDALRLEAIFPTRPLGDPTAVRSPQYVKAFKSVLRAAMDAIHPNGTMHGVGLSLAHNALDAIHLEAVVDVLSSATRALSSLSLDQALSFTPSMTPTVSERLMKAIVTIAFCPSNAIDDPGSELDLSGSYISQRDADVFLRALTECVTRSLPLVRQALTNGRPVSCLGRVGISNEQHDDELPLPLGIDTSYAVVSSCTDDASVEIVCGATTRPVAVSAIVQLVVDGTPIVQSRFTRLILDARVDDNVPSDDQHCSSTVPVCSCPTQTLLQALGPRLTFLSMRGYEGGHRNDLFVALAPCPRLQSLNLDGSGAFAHPKTPWVRVLNTLCDLETLNLSATRMTHWMMEAFVHTLVKMPHLRLKTLLLAQNQLRDHNLPQFARLLDALPSLQLLELDSIGRSKNMADFIAGRRVLVRDYHGVIVASMPLSACAKRAFLSVAPTCCDGFAGVKSPVVRTIFEMAAPVTLRCVLWHGSKQS